MRGPVKNALVVNVYFDDLRRIGGRPYSAPQAIGPTYLAGAFHPRHCRVRLYNEQYSGPLLDAAQLRWADMLVMTGLTVSLDRMRQLTAYARSANPAIVVVAGGPPVRALPRYSARFFDYCCVGDVEELLAVVRDAFGPAYVADEMFPRFDLTYWFGRLAYMESSRHCNFKCSFCSLTGERARYHHYDLDYIRRQVLAIGRPRLLTFLDNNFYGNSRDYYRQRTDLLGELWRQGRFGNWTALVSSDFFLKQDNLDRARDAGCVGMFSGVESFDAEVLRRFNKHQNTPLPQVELIRRCLDSGLIFAYGLVFDLSERTLADCREELAFVTGTPEIPLPAFATQAIPLLGTPYFRRCVEQGSLLPMTKLRDMDGSTLVQYPLDPIGQVTDFLRGLPTLQGYRGRVLRHCAGFLRRYGRQLDWVQKAIAMSSALMTVAPGLASAPAQFGRNRVAAGQRTFVTTTEPLDRHFRPALPVAARYRDHFAPTMVTDPNGCLDESVAADLTADADQTAERPLTV